MPTVSFNHYFPDYEILGEISISNARVLKARHKLTGELVAIKHLALNTSEETRKRFQLELEIMIKIQHPNIVQIKHWQLDIDMPYIVMELIEGGDLGGLLKERTSLDTATVISIASQITDAFNVIHPKGIIHRDIKPENIMYRVLHDGKLQFLLTDFGIAKSMDQSNTVTGQSMMTIEYASPEQFERPKSITSATDYYSLGVVLYQCLSGKAPFVTENGNIGKLINQVLKTPAPPVQLPAKGWLPPSIVSLVNKLLIKNDAQRLKDPATVKNMLKEAETEVPFNLPKKKKSSLFFRTITPLVIIVIIIMACSAWLENYKGLDGIWTKIRVAREYDSKGINFSGGLAKVKKDDKYGYIDKKGSLVIPLKYDAATDFKNIFSSYAAVKKDGKWGIIDDENHTLVSFEYDNLGILPEYFWFNETEVKKNGVWGTIEKAGSFISFRPSKKTIELNNTDSTAAR